MLSDLPLISILSPPTEPYLDVINKIQHLIYPYVHIIYVLCGKSFILVLTEADLHIKF